MSRAKHPAKHVCNRLGALKQHPRTDLGVQKLCKPPCSLLLPLWPLLTPGSQAGWWILGGGKVYRWCQGREFPVTLLQRQREGWED